MAIIMFALFDFILEIFRDEMYMTMTMITTMTMTMTMTIKLSQGQNYALTRVYPIRQTAVNYLSYLKINNLIVNNS